jgi:hypothetical protein
MGGRGNRKPSTVGDTVELKDACGQEKGNNPLVVSENQSPTVTADGLSVSRPCRVVEAKEERNAASTTDTCKKLVVIGSTSEGSRTLVP